MRSGDPLDLIEVQHVVSGVELHHVSRALFTALGVDADAFQVVGRRALDQRRLSRRRIANVSSDSLGSASA